MEAQRGQDLETYLPILREMFPQKRICDLRRFAEVNGTFVGDNRILAGPLVDKLLLEMEQELGDSDPRFPDVVPSRTCVISQLPDSVSTEELVEMLDMTKDKVLKVYRSFSDKVIVVKFADIEGFRAAFVFHGMHNMVIVPFKFASLVLKNANLEAV